MASPREVSWEEVFDIVLEARLRGVHTAMMGQFRSYSESAQTAEVTLAVHLPTADGDFEEVAPQGAAPVLWPGAWEAGDKCLLVFCEESFAKWFETGSVEPPELLRRHGLHGVCIPLVAPGGAAVQFVALANLVNAQLTALANAFSTWVVAPNDGGAALKAKLSTLAGTGWPADVSAQKVKAR